MIGVLCVSLDFDTLIWMLSPLWHLLNRIFDIWTPPARFDPSEAVLHHFHFVFFQMFVGVTNLQLPPEERFACCRLYLLDVTEPLDLPGLLLNPLDLHDLLRDLL